MARKRLRIEKLNSNRNVEGLTRKVVLSRWQGTSRFLAQGGGGGGHFEVKEGHPDFFTNNMIFLECGVIALFEAFFMFRDHNHVK